MGDKVTTQGTILVTNDLIITNDGLNYTLQKTGVSKSGKRYNNILGHYSSPEKALIAAKQFYTRTKLNEAGEIALPEAVSIIVRSNNHFEALIKNAFRGVIS